MEEVIKQIVQIDSVAVMNRESSEQALQEKRRKYESQMESYHEEQIRKAQIKAETLYNQIVGEGETSHTLESNKSRNLAGTIRNKYLEIEKTLLDEVFNELFEVEG